MPVWSVIIVGFGIILVSLYFESVRLAMIRRSLNLRIGVTGTRGKSSVTRLIAAALRNSGHRVVAKTTGSRPMLIHVDGSEERIDRTGVASIIEQKKLLFLALSEHASAFVSEIMSILPENQAVESARILGLNVCVITNVRVDHESEQGSSKPAVATALSTSVPKGGIVICTEGADLPELRMEVLRKGATLKVAPQRLSCDLRELVPHLGYDEFEENLSVALETCLCLGLDAELALRSMADTTPDLGALRTWSWVDETHGAQVSFTNAFAANDVESSLIVLDRVIAGTISGSAVPLVGILNLRADRGERTLQWMKVIRNGLPGALAAIHVTGAHARLVAWRLRNSGIRCVTANSRRPDELFSALLYEYPEGVQVIGLGNIAGTGAGIVAWCAGRVALETVGSDAC